MAFKTLSTVVTADTCGDALELAIACANAWSAHLDVTCVNAAQIDVQAQVVPDLGMVMPLMTQDATDDLHAVQRRVEDRLNGEPFGWSVSGHTQYSVELAWDIARMRRFSDLAILAASKAGLSDLDRSMVEALLYHSRVPILIAPGDVRPSFDHVALAWDGSDVALGAIRAAMPILGRARTVEIVTVDPGSDMAGHDLAVMLDRHGIGATLTCLPRNGRRIAEALTDHARDVDADLLVMGAYGHSRLREVFLGGVTRRMLDAVPLPLLLAR